MKRNVVIVSVLVLMFAFLMQPAFAANINVDNTMYEPYPAQSGSYIDVWFKVENIGAETAQNVTVEFVPSYPFSLDSTASPFKIIGTLSPYEPYVFKYKVLVDRDALSGTNEINLRFTDNPKTGIWVSKYYAVTIQTNIVALNIVDISTVPEVLVPGQEGSIMFTLENNADSALKDVSIRLNISTAAMPFAPLGSVTEKNVRSISKGDTYDVVYNVITLADAESKVYKVPVMLSYSDSSGTTYVKSDILGLMVSARPELYLNLEDTDVYKSGASGEIVLSVANTGVSEARYVIMEVVSSDRYNLFGSPKTYLGNIEPDDFETAEFNIYFKNTSASSVPVAVRFVYKDTYNVEHSEVMSIDVPMYSQQDLINFNQYAAPSSTGTYVIVVVLVIVGYLAYRRFFRKKKKDK